MRPIGGGYQGGSRRQFLSDGRLHGVRFMEITHVAGPDDSRNRLHVPGLSSEGIGSGFPPVERRGGGRSLIQCRTSPDGIALLRALSDVDDSARWAFLRFKGLLDQTFDRDAILSKTAPINTEATDDGWTAYRAPQFAAVSTGRVKDQILGFYVLRPRGRSGVRRFLEGHLGSCGSRGGVGERLTRESFGQTSMSWLGLTGARSSSALNRASSPPGRLPESPPKRSLSPRLEAFSGGGQHCSSPLHGSGITATDHANPTQRLSERSTKPFLRDSDQVQDFVTCWRGRTTTLDIIHGTRSVHSRFGRMRTSPMRGTL